MFTALCETRAPLVTLVSLSYTRSDKPYECCATNYMSVIHVQKKEGKARFGLTMSPELLKRIDEKRGLIPRATYIEHCMKQYFELETLRSEEIKFYEEIQAMLRNLMTEEKTGRILSGISLISSKIAEKRESMITTK